MSDDIRTAVRDRYGRLASSDSCCGNTEKAASCCSEPAESESCCGESASSCGCSGGQKSEAFGYSADELAELPEGADLALGCGNPTALAEIREGDTVVDLGSGGGIDCFLAGRRVGDSGKVIGVDMTPEMIDRARKNAADGGFSQVEFRLGEIENLPIADASANLVISNCVINLSPDKTRVFSEAHRVLVPGGQMMVSDLVLTKQLPRALAKNVHLLTGCIAGAMVQADYLKAMSQAGFAEVAVERESEYVKLEHLQSLAEGAGISSDDAAAIAGSVRSISVRARKAG